MLKFIGPMREPDKYGSGEYGASRGDRKHNGIDIACAAGSEVLAPVSGEVTKLGYPYGDDLSYRYIEITDAGGYRVRLFYVDPSVALHQHISMNQPVGLVQTLQGRYPGITDHVHLEVIRPAGSGYMSWFDYREKVGVA